MPDRHLFTRTGTNKEKSFRSGILVIIRYFFRIEVDHIDAIPVQ